MKDKRILLPLLTALLLTVGFEIGLELANVSRFILPKPSLVLKALSENWPWIFANLKVTVQEAIVGFGLSLILGVGLALSYLFLPQLEPIIVPLAVAIRNVPFVAIAPILFITLGYGQTPKILIVMIVSFFPIMANTAAGFQSVNKYQLERFTVLRASRWQLFTKLQLPTALPFFATGVDVAASNIIISAIVGELLGTTQGLGFVILMSVSQFRFALLMAAVVVTTVVSILLTWFFQIATRNLFKKWL
ncbi:MAG: putative aliphatic sulfonates transport permease protein SsuC [Microgenomates group bacterium ADurb.Bin219]|nr:MAG: putative aliphatic sulfonates transport permease protein SsuC [Microgenomates group bacterium ADurb.Bin219]HNP89125.1 ABC transporter permease subunit [Candidatus Woesebacteria bacterium]